MERNKIIIVIITGVIIAAGIFYSVADKEPVNSNISFIQETEEDLIVSQEDNTAVSTAVHNGFSDSNSAKFTEMKEETGEKEEYSYIHICGEVKLPGVYEVQKGTRLVEVIELAGGMTESAAGDYVNQAEKVEDGQKIYIPSQKELEGISVYEYSRIQNNSNIDNSEKADSLEQNLVNINTATVAELMTLPGIGKAKAKSIISYREIKGHFKSVEELKNIEGIKDGVFNKIRDSVMI